MQALVGKQYAIGTLSRFKALEAHVRAFLVTKKLKDIDIRQVDQRLISNFEFYLRSSQDCANNTTVKYLKNLGKIIRICLMNQWIDRDPMLGYKLRSENVERPFLTADELERIHQIQFHTPRLGQVRDVFLFCCYTGLSYADVVTLSLKNIQPGVDGHQWIFANRTKTGTRSAIPLLPKAKVLLEKYQDDPYCQSRDKLLPVTSNQKLNEYLKEIAERCHINKVLTMHIARHTFATTVTLQNGIPIETVSKMLGHTSLRTTQIYAKVLDSKIGKDMESLRGKF
ncbi:site-specific integrase [Pedobacter sp. SYP-B3415]|uniref:site-specific integrase n=1 Tax=Pedobacter sp. SYP-B3415 TaxID=2496641 RepID=UPI001F0E72C7|nr:site-specific integrase [Pedobacter sp. SYP-B3415]